MAAINLKNVSKTYGEATVIDELTFSVREGEVFGLIGPNGAGKSTTIELLLDYTRPTSGCVEVLGRDPRADITEVHADVGILPDQDALLPGLSGRDHLRYVAASNDAEDNIEQLLSLVDLEASADDPTASYSTGMSQRLSMGLALVGDPDLLILDEPFTGLDPIGVEVFEAVIESKQSSGTTILISSHDLSRIETLCDRVGVLKSGSLVAKGTPEEFAATTDEVLQLVVSVDELQDRAVRAVETLDCTRSVERSGNRLEIEVGDERHKREVASAIQEHGGLVVGFESRRRSFDQAFVRHMSTDSA